MWLNFHWKFLWELEEFAFSYGLQLLCMPQCMARPTRTPCPSLPTQAVGSHKKFCGDRSAPHYAAQGEHSSSIAHSGKTVYLRLPHFHLHSHHQKRHRKIYSLYLWNITVNFIRSDDKKAWSCSGSKIQTIFWRYLTFIQILWENPEHHKELRNYALISHLGTK